MAWQRSGISCSLHRTRRSPASHSELAMELGEIPVEQDLHASLAPDRLETVSAPVSDPLRWNTAADGLRDVRLRHHIVSVRLPRHGDRNPEALLQIQSKSVCCRRERLRIDFSPISLGPRISQRELFEPPVEVGDIAKRPARLEVVDH